MSEIAWSGWTRVSEERFIAEKGQRGVVEGRVFKTKADAEAYYAPLKRWETIVEIQVLRPTDSTRAT